MKISKKSTKKFVVGMTSMALAMSIMASVGASAYTNDPALYDPQPETLTVETERSGHTYTYYQMFTGRWFEDEDAKIWLTDAAFGADLDAEGLVNYLKTNYADELNAIYVQRAVAAKLVSAGATIDDVKTAYIDWKGEEAWAASDYNIDNFKVGDDTVVEDVLDIFKAIQEANPERPSENPHINGADYEESDNHAQFVTNGNKTVIDILRQFKKGDGTELEADYNESKSVSVDNGYYMVLEKDEGWDKEGRNAVSGASREAVLMKIVDRQIKITPKLGTPEFEKKIAENVKDVDSVGDGLIGAYKNLIDETKWNDAADYSIGDEVPFALFGGMPENIRDYEHYYYHFGDRLAKGFDAPEVTDIKVQIGKTDPVQKPSDGNNYAAERTFVGYDITDKATITVGENADGSSKLDITFNDLLSVDDDIDDFEIDMDTVVLVTYKAELNKDAVIGNKGNTNMGYLEYSVDLSYDGTGGDTTTDESPEDGVVAFTYEVDVNKIDGKTLEELGGAVFTLQAKDGDHEGQYVVIDENGKIAGWTNAVEEANYMTTDNGGDIVISGLDDGKYELVEVKAPRGYHSQREPIEITIDASLNKDGTYIYIEDDGTAAFLDFKKGTSAAEANATVDKEAGKYMVDVINNKGITLPQTGGTGAYALYAIGGLAAIAGGVYFVTRKKKEE